MDEETLGCLGIGEEDTDYLLCDGDGDLLPTLYKQNEVRFEYNQGAEDRSENSCTIFAAMGMLSDLIDYEFSKAEMKEVDELSYTTNKYPVKRVRGHGWYVKYAVDLVCDWYNASELSKKLGKVAYYRMNKHSTMVEDAISKLYTLDTNFCPTKEYSADYRKDAMLDGTDFGTNTNGHSTDIISKEGQRSVKDSYKGRKTYDKKQDCNIYGLKHQLSEISNYGEWLYIYTKVKEDNLEEIKRLNKMRSLTENMIKDNSEMWHLTNDENYKAKLHEMNELNREKIEHIKEQLKKYL